MATMDPYKAAERVRLFAREEGFELAGIARIEPGGTKRAAEYRRWISEGKHGAMEYLARNVDQRLDVTRKFPWAKTLLCVGIAYGSERSPGKPDGNAAVHGIGKIARYAWGRDYHKVVEGKLKRVERKIRAAFAAESEAPLQMRGYCDTGPVLERDWAARAGLGWIGKHTLLIHPRHGSYFLLGELIMSLELPGDEPMADHCRTCRRCIEACPTDAIAPYTVDATRCISYHTLENRGEIGAEFHGAMRAAGYVVGCDICQEVCPFNRQPLLTVEADFAARAPAPAMDLQQILAWQEHDWDVQTRGRAFRRTKLTMWQRNARIVAGD